MRTINIGGQDRVFHVGTNQGDIFCRLQGLTLKQYGEIFSDLTTLGFGVQRDFLFAALKAGAEREGKPLDFTNLAVGDWMDAPEYDAGATFGVVVSALAEQFTARAEYQQQREVKNALGPAATPAGPKAKN